MNVEAVQAANFLEKVGISCEVIDLRTVSSLDEKTMFDSIKKTNLKGHFKLKLINSRLISKLFKASEKEIKKYCGKTLSFYNLNYREISSDEYKKQL